MVVVMVLIVIEAPPLAKFLQRAPERPFILYERSFCASITQSQIGTNRYQDWDK